MFDTSKNRNVKKYVTFSDRVIVSVYRLTGKSCETADLLYPDGIPADLQRACDRARADAMKIQPDGQTALDREGDLNLALEIDRIRKLWGKK